MSVEVSKGLCKGSATVPSWLDFCELKQKLKESEDNKQALWDAVNQFKRDRRADIYAEFRALRDAAFTAYKQLNGPLPEGEWTAWKCIGVAGKRLDALEQRLNALPDAMRETVREAVRAELKPLFESVLANLDGLLKDNGELKSKADSLSNEVERYRVRVESAEKQFQKVPDKVAELQRLLDDAKENLNCSRSENAELRKELDALRAVNGEFRANLDSLRDELVVCQEHIEELLNPPKRNWFKGMFSRSGEFFRKIFTRRK